MRAAEVAIWREYLRARVQAKGWDAQRLVRGVRAVPRTLPQGHRWFLLKVHLNAPMTSSRMATVGHGPVLRCAFCRTDGGESWQHLARCGVVLSICDDLFAMGRMPPLHDALPALMLQGDADGASVSATVAVFASIWRVRASCNRLQIVPSLESLRRLVEQSLDCPWLVRCEPTSDRRSRRQARLREPAACPGAAIYRSDGASRGQGIAGDSLGGWGSAVWAPTERGLGEGPP